MNGIHFNYCIINIKYSHTCILYGFKHFMAIIGTLKKQYQTAVAMNLKLYNLFLRDQLFHLKDSKTFWEC
jgi:hypothetical protein